MPPHWVGGVDPESTKFFSSNFLLQEQQGIKEQVKWHRKRANFPQTTWFLPLIKGREEKERGERLFQMRRSSEAQQPHVLYRCGLYPYPKNCKNIFWGNQEIGLWSWILTDAGELLLILLSAIMTCWLCKKKSILFSYSYYSFAMILDMTQLSGIHFKIFQQRKKGEQMKETWGKLLLNLGNICSCYYCCVIMWSQDLLS